MTRTCYSCDEQATTREHIPPRGLFPKDRRKQLITVPSCRPCNEDSSQDDEYFVAALSANWSVSPAAQEVWNERIGPGLNRPDFEGLRERLRRATQPVTLIVDDKSIETGRFSLEVPRFLRVIKKVVRGLYYIHVGRAIPSTYVVDAYLQPRDPLLSMAQSANFASADDDVFMYRWVVAEEISMWWLLFYKTVLVVGVAGPRELMPERQRS